MYYEKYWKTIYKIYIIENIIWTIIINNKLPLLVYTVSISIG